MRKTETPEPRRSQREAQREQTRAVLVETARSLIRSGSEVTMPAIAQGAGVSEATAYRYFPDLLSIMEVAFVGVWPSADDVMPSTDVCGDPVERVAIATEFLARGVFQLEGAVRAMIALTIARPEVADVRPGHRIGLIEAALAPLASAGRDRLEQLVNDLSVVVSAEAFFTLLDLRKLPPEAAVASLVETAKSLVRAAIREEDRRTTGS